MSHPVWIWIVSATLYAAFLGWYVNWSGPLAAAEVDAFVEKISALPEFDGDDARLATLRKFLEEDDGRELFMVNLLRLRPGSVVPPGGSEPEPARQVLERYSRPFLGALLWRAGHPAFFARAAGKYLERWEVEDDPGWTAAGIIRYRSRRDLAAMVAMPEFEQVHPFKYAALSNTLAFPASPGMVFVGPVVWVGLVLALLAALAHLILR